MDVTFTTDSDRQTIELGREFGRLLKPGDVVCLYGELGSGKTTFIKGIASALDIDEDEITSASFVIIAEHEGRFPLYHIDLYRVEGEDALFETGLYEYLDGDGISVVEWAERLNGDCSFEVTIEIVEGEKRRIVFRGPERVLSRLKPVDKEVL